MIDWDVVIPMIGRPHLHKTIEALFAGEGPMPGNVFVVDDRKPAADNKPLFDEQRPETTVRLGLCPPAMSQGCPITQRRWRKEFARFAADAELAFLQGKVARRFALERFGLQRSLMTGILCSKRP